MAYIDSAVAVVWASNWQIVIPVVDGLEWPCRRGDYVLQGSDGAVADVANHDAIRHAKPGGIELRIAKGQNIGGHLLGIDLGTVVLRGHGEIAFREQNIVQLVRRTSTGCFAVDGRIAAVKLAVPNLQNPGICRSRDRLIGVEEPKI